MILVQTSPALQCKCSPIILLNLRRWHVVKSGLAINMPSSEHLNGLETQCAGVLAEVDQLQLPTAAAYVDLALRGLKDVNAAGPSGGTAF